MSSYTTNRCLKKVNIFFGLFYKPLMINKENPGSSYPALEKPLGKILLSSLRLPAKPAFPAL